ncbi:hypothetical protein ACERIT_10465 [Halopenitus sp. H-Gu1]|uniref:hypothetical protein n=1 Tax=Halopenitus sp. H-Gu1 TaxID=3242697 RepID=UPI00359E4FEC
MSSDSTETARSDHGAAPDPSKAAAEPAPGGFGRAGWLLAAAVIGCTLVIPGIIYVYPYALGVLDFGFFGAYLALPMIPAVLLGLVAVWTMSAATSDHADRSAEHTASDDDRGDDDDGTYDGSREPDGASGLDGSRDRDGVPDPGDASPSDYRGE